ncbi:unnamed protein product [Notodromas monacha]|uniref:Uncharacterized protein n=1 Tax=Notodromas monacha TaxID=399045 RepID=A0A7R9BML1_9CRUS|nr:unnamed protein product [Notodromas monacha]CAG0917172.1 unnamed protein product [Notodromas monacha]
MRAVSGIVVFFSLAWMSIAKPQPPPLPSSFFLETSSRPGFPVTPVTQLGVQNASDLPVRQTVVSQSGLNGQQGDFGFNRTLGRPFGQDVFGNQTPGNLGGDRFNQQPSDRFNNQQPDRFSDQQPDRFNNQQPDRFNNQQPDRFNNQQPDRFNNQQPDRFNNQQPDRFNNQQPDRFNNQQPDRFNNQQPDRFNTDRPSSFPGDRFNPQAGFNNDRQRPQQGPFSTTDRNPFTSSTTGWSSDRPYSGDRGRQPTGTDNNQRYNPLYPNSGLRPDGTFDEGDPRNIDVSVPEPYNEDNEVQDPKTLRGDNGGMSEFAGVQHGSPFNPAFNHGESIFCMNLLTLSLAVILAGAV